MDFDPQHPKWICCCCHLANGLMILASSEIAVSIVLLVYSITYIVVPNPDGNYDDTTLFLVILMSVSIMYAITSALLIFGIHKYKEKLMYPTLVARAVVVIFMQAFGVSIVVRPSDAISEVHFEESETQKITTNLDDKKNEHEASTGQRLAMLIFLMIVISAFVFYTIYLIVRCIHYVKAYKRLMHRKRSLIIVCHIDPMNQQNSKSRRSSRRSM